MPYWLDQVAHSSELRSASKQTDCTCVAKCLDLSGWICTTSSTTSVNSREPHTKSPIHAAMVLGCMTTRMYLQTYCLHLSYRMHTPWHVEKRWQQLISIDVGPDIQNLISQWVLIKHSVLLSATPITKAEITAWHLSTVDCRMPKPDKLTKCKKMKLEAPI